MSEDNEYYVYVYVDPRNFEEFYYGKGRDNRKEAHLSDFSDSRKRDRIDAIKADGQKPIIKVIARGLSEREAFLVEKTLLWKLGSSLLNESSGSGGFAEKFRPDNKMHVDLAGFDFTSGIYYFNVGEGEHRCWSDCRRYGFISAGGSPRWRDAISGFQVGDVFVAYLKGRGFVGVGQITTRARPIREVLVNGRPLLDHELTCSNMRRGVECDDTCEYVALVEWIRTFSEGEARWKPRSRLYTTTHVRASLEAQKETLEFIEAEFALNMRSLLERRASPPD